MGFSYRKSVKMGPIRVTASKSGISYSAGVKGARVTKRADGRTQATLSVPGTGVRYTSTSRSTSAKPKSRRGSSEQVQPKPEILPGQRYSVLPRQPSPGIRPLVFKGYLASVILSSDAIRIDRKFMGRINGNRSAVIPWLQLVAVDFCDPTKLINGHVHFVTAADPRGLTPTGGGNRIAAAARNSHAIMFTWRQRATYQRFRDLLVANPAIPPASANFASSGNNHRAGSQHSIADELAKLHALCQQGALTVQEYEQAKARLLGSVN
jgi:hypothetical protein